MFLNRFIHTRVDVRHPGAAATQHQTTSTCSACLLAKVNHLLPKFLAAHHELRCTEPRHLPRGNATSVFQHSIFYKQPLIAKFYTVARKIPFEDPVILNYVRIGYIVSQVLILGAYYYVSLAVCSLFRGPSEYGSLCTLRSRRRMTKRCSNTVSLSLHSRSRLAFLRTSYVGSGAFLGHGASPSPFTPELCTYCS